MKDEDYKPFYVNNIIEVNDTYYILYGWPRYDYNEDLYYEIHIKADRYLSLIKNYVNESIYIDFISPGNLEIYYGDNIYECQSDGEMSYTAYLYKYTEKGLKDEWKPQFKELKNQLDNLLAERLPEYALTRDKVVENYKLLYRKIEPLYTDIIDNAGVEIFNRLLSLFGPFNSHLYPLINPNKELILYKDWESDYLHTETMYNNLLKIDLHDYAIIRDHVIGIYENTFNHMLLNLKYSFKEVDETVYKHIFKLVIGRLGETTK